VFFRFGFDCSFDSLADGKTMIQPGSKSSNQRAAEIQKLLDDGTVKNRAELARWFAISRARVTQILGKQ
jgi:hypothetical protein